MWVGSLFVDFMVSATLEHGALFMGKLVRGSLEYNIEKLAPTNRVAVR